MDSVLEQVAMIKRCFSAVGSPTVALLMLALGGCLRTAREEVDYMKQKFEYSYRLALMPGEARTDDPSLVKALTLENSGLRSVPNTLTNYPALEYVDLSRNQVTLDANDQMILKKIDRLTYLDLKSNGLQAVDLSDVVSLKCLSLCGNPLGENIVRCRFPRSLWALQLPMTEIRALPDLSNLQDIRHLDLSFNRLGKIGAELRALKRLDALYCIYCDLHSIENGGLPATITELQLGVNPLGCIPDAVLSLRRVEHLVLSQCGISFIPDEMRKMKSLRTVTLHTNGIKELPAWIADLPDIEVFDVTRNPIESIPDSLKRMVSDGILLVDTAAAGSSGL
jgi:leucine-rich repeat protein SHOC2